MPYHMTANHAFFNHMTSPTPMTSHTFEKYHSDVSPPFSNVSVKPEVYDSKLYRPFDATKQETYDSKPFRAYDATKLHHPRASFADMTSFHPYATELKYTNSSFADSNHAHFLNTAAAARMHAYSCSRFPDISATAAASVYTDRVGNGYAHLDYELSAAHRLAATLS